MKNISKDIKISAFPILIHSWEDFFLKMDLHEKAGLIPAGKNEDGEQMYLGTKKQWQDYEELEIAKDEMIENETNAILETEHEEELEENN